MIAPLSFSRFKLMKEAFDEGDQSLKRYQSWSSSGLIWKPFVWRRLVSLCFEKKLLRKRTTCALSSHPPNSITTFNVINLDRSIWFLPQGLNVLVCICVPFDWMVMNFDFSPLCSVQLNGDELGWFLCLFSIVYFQLDGDELDGLRICGWRKV